MQADLQNPQGVYQQPSYQLVVDGRDITPTVRARLVQLSLREARSGEADQLDITLDDSDGRMRIPARGAKVTLRLGYTRGGDMADKGEFVVDEVEHSGAPDVINITARSADMRGKLRNRTSGSWHRKTLGDVLGDIAKRNALELTIEPALAAKQVQHMDQTNESDANFLTRLATLHDAVATVKKGKLLFLPVGTAANAKGQTLPKTTITRQTGDQHRYHSADRNSYTGVRAYWHDKGSAKRQAAIDGTEDNLKTLKETYATKEAALAAARAESGRLARGEATFELTLAIGDPFLMVQGTFAVQGFKAEIDGAEWLAKNIEHTLSDQGLVTRLELERKGSGNTSDGGASVPASDWGEEDQSSWTPGDDDLGDGADS